MSRRAKRRKERKKAKQKKPSISQKETPPKRQAPLRALKATDTRTRFLRTLTTVKSYIVALATLATLIGGYILFVPRLSVSDLPALNPSEPFSTPFSIINDGNFSIYSIEYSCNLKYIENENHNVMKNGGLVNFTSLRKELEPAAKDTVTCPFNELVQRTQIFRTVFNAPIVAADISLVVSFRNYFGLSFTRTFPLMTERAADGKLYWFHKAE